MKILLTNDELHEVRGGTQVFVADLAKELQRRGHQVAVYSWLRGSLAKELTNEGVPVVALPRDCGFIPDIIHAQHHLATMTALCAFPGVPAIYHCHGYAPWQECPPVHPRIFTYVGMAKAMSHWMAKVTGRKPEDIFVLPNSVPLEKFKRVRAPRRQPRRALLFGNSMISGENISRLRRACERSGLTLQFVGAPFGNVTSTPEDLLPDYDIVFSIGRSAIEAMASGCAVIPFSNMGCGPLMRPELLEAWSSRNFTVPERGYPVEVESIIRQIKKFDPGVVSAIASQIRLTASFEHGCGQLEKLYEHTMGRWKTHSTPSAELESEALSLYLADLGPYIKGADERFAALRHQRDHAKERLRHLQQKLGDLKKKMSAVEKRLPGFIRRWLLRDV